MGVTILVCACGRRVRAPGARPGRVGRCPACGRLLEVPAEPAPLWLETTPGAESSANVGSRQPAQDAGDTARVGGYFLEYAERPRSGQAGKSKRQALSSSSLPSRAPAGRRNSKSNSVNRVPMADGFLPPLAHPETGTVASILYPLRGAEALAMVAIMGTAFWGFTILVPEYCLSVWDDANTLGTPSVGRLVILISALPTVILFPLILIYTLQYLGRILVSSAMGDSVPPRTPDRNFDGFLTGLYPWLIWLVVGIVVGLFPLLFSALFVDQAILGNSILTVGLVMLGLPYAEVALMMSFLHERTLAATPWGVAGSLLRHVGSFLPTVFKVTVLMGLAGVIFALVLTLRASYFWFYLLAVLGWWTMAIWIALIVMRILGVHYFHHKDSLAWNPERLRWGVAWRL
jgi:hypothetical protein